MTTTVSAAAETTGQPKGGFWIRFVAYLIDAIILGIVGWVISSILFQGEAIRSGGMNTLLSIAYFVYFWSAAGKGQTPGMRVMNLKVVKTDGSMLDYVGAFLRWVGLIIAAIPLFIGLIWVAFEPNKQGWHDKIAGTYVIRV